MRSLLFLLMLSSSVYAADKEVEAACQELTKIYDFSVESKRDDINYTSVLYTFAVNYVGGPDGLYYLFKAAETAYKDVESKKVIATARTEFYNECVKTMPTNKPEEPKTEKEPTIDSKYLGVTG